MTMLLPNELFGLNIEMYDWNAIFWLCKTIFLLRTKLAFYKWI